MKKGGYLKRICALLLVFVMVFTDAEMLVFAEEVQEAEETQQTEDMHQAEEAQQTEETPSGTEKEVPEVVTEENGEIKDKEVAYKTDFAYSDSSVTVTAKASENAKFSENTVLCVDYITPDTAKYEAELTSVKEKLGVLNNRNMDFYGVLYDIYFMADGQRIEPAAGTVQVAMTFAQPAELNIPDEQKVVDTVIMHIENNGNVEKIDGNVSLNHSGSICGVGFASESFSTYASGMITESVKGINAAENVLKNAAGIGRAASADVKDYLNGITLYQDLDGKVEYNPNTELSRGEEEKIAVELRFSELYGGRQFPEDGILRYQIPDVLEINEAVHHKPIYGTLDRPDMLMGYMDISLDGEITFTLNPEYVGDYGNLFVSAMFEANFKGEKISDKNTHVIDFGNDVTKTVTFEPLEDVDV